MTAMQTAEEDRSGRSDAMGVENVLSGAAAAAFDSLQPSAVEQMPCQDTLHRLQHKGDPLRLRCQ